MDDGHARPCGQVGQERGQSLAAVRVDHRGRLVGYQQPRLASEGGRYRQALQFTAG